MSNTKPTTMRTYAAAVGVLDFAALLTTSLIAYFMSYGEFFVADNVRDAGLLRLEITPQFIGLGLLIAWLLALSIFKTRDPKLVGSDFSEYRRVVNAALAVLGSLAFVALFFKVDVSRVYVFSVVLFGLVALLLERRLSRAWLRKQRRRGRFTRRVALYGPKIEIAYELAKFERNKETEFEPIFVVEDGENLKLRLLSDNRTQDFEISDLALLCKKHNVELVQVVGVSSTAEHIHKRIYWALDGYDISLVMSPTITDISSSKLTTRVIAGSPLLEIASTKFTGPQYVVKTSFDILFSIFALAVASPVMLVTALAIKAIDGGPIFFKQIRVGVNGKEFQIIKFRSMKVGAENEFDELSEQMGYEVNSVQFKLKDDPRVTKVGQFIRKTSIDEMPQFLNVLFGDMSVVGPRPHVQKEVDAYQDHAARRLLVKPGITGPWQVGGRSLLSWEESIALDVGYVSSWSFSGDLALILATIKVMSSKTGL